MGKGMGTQKERINKNIHELIESRSKRLTAYEQQMKSFEMQ
jgi:hypothetical protein